MISNATRSVENTCQIQNVHTPGGSNVTHDQKPPCGSCLFLRRSRSTRIRSALCFGTPRETRRVRNNFCSSCDVEPLGRVTEHRRSWKMLGSWLHRKGAELGWAIPSWTEPFLIAVVPDPDRMVRWFGHAGHHGYVFFTNMTFVCCRYACSGLLSSSAASPRAGGAPVLSQNFGRCPNIPSCASG